ncbi:unnamed protein product [Closterium sp. NIES-54]
MHKAVIPVPIATIPVPCSGFCPRDPFGDGQTVRPLLYAWVCDYPESGKISCTLSHGSQMPCSICYDAKVSKHAICVPSEPSSSECHMTDLIISPPLPVHPIPPPVLHQEHLVAVKARNTPRTPEQQQWIVNEAAGLTSSQDEPCKTYSTYPVEVSDLFPGKLCSLRTPCCSNLGEMCSTPLHCPTCCVPSLSNTFLYHFPPHPLFECVLWKWDVPGTVWGNPYLVIMPDIMHQADLGMMSHIVAVVRKMKKRHVKQMDRSAIETGTQTLINESYFLPVELPEEPTSTNWFARTWVKQHPVAQAALKDALVSYAGCVPKIRAHASLAIPAADDASFSRVSHFVRATPDYFERPWYSDVAVEGVRYGRREEWYARLLLLFHTKIRGEREEMAYIRYWNACGEDAATGCTRFKWTSGVYAYSVIPLEALLRHVHVVKAFHLNSTYLLNKYHM